MQCQFWGAGLWRALFCIAFNYPEDKPTSVQKHDHKVLFEALAGTMPCRYCRESWAAYLRELPIDPFLENRKSLQMWCYKMKQRVNAKLGKPDISYEEYIETYEAMRAKCSAAKKGCTESFRNVAEQDVPGLAAAALEKYGNVEQRVASYKLQCAYKRAAQATLSALAILLAAYLLLPYVGRVAKALRKVRT